MTKDEYEDAKLRTRLLAKQGWRCAACHAAGGIKVLMREEQKVVCADPCWRVLRQEVTQ